MIDLKIQAITVVIGLIALGIRDLWINRNKQDVKK